MDWIVSWWDTVFHSICGGSPFMMFFFGWEIFLIPFGFVFALLGAAGSAVGAAFGAVAGRTKPRDAE